MFLTGGVNFFAEIGILYAFQESNFAGKAVIVLLLLGSIFSWSIMITKFSGIGRARRETDQFLKKFRSNREPLTIYQRDLQFTGSPAYEVYVAGCRELSYHLVGDTELDDTFRGRVESARRIPPVLMGSVKTAMERAVGEQGLKLEDRMIVLATTVSGAPFLGLLGTVWGVMDTFTGIAMAGSASLAAMAPGVAGALITTVMGLLVAIPAMFGYNYLVVSVRGMTVELDNFAAELASAMEHLYVDTRR